MSPPMESLRLVIAWPVRLAPDGERTVEIAAKIAGRE